MKYLKYFLVIGILIINVSFNTSRTSRIADNLYAGNLLPDIANVKNVAGAKIDLSDLKGQKVLVVFWATYDANSRMEHLLLANAIKENEYPVTMVSFSFDPSESIYKRTIAMDKMDKEYQFWVDPNSYDELFSKYKLEQSFKNYLIDEDGITTAMNLDVQQLNKLLTEI